MVNGLRWPALERPGPLPTAGRKFESKARQVCECQNAALQSLPFGYGDDARPLRSAPGKLAIKRGPSRATDQASRENAEDANTRHCQVDASIPIRRRGESTPRLGRRSSDVSHRNKSRTAGAEASTRNASRSAGIGCANASAKNSSLSTTTLSADSAGRPSRLYQI